jgi:hypothetical protein
MKKFAVAVAVLVMAVVGFSFPTAVVACDNDNERFEVASLDGKQSPPPGKITVRTVVETIEGFNISYWGRPGLEIKKGTAIQKWVHPNGEVIVYNLFLPDERTAKEVLSSPKLPGVLTSMKARIRQDELKKASVGSHVWLDISLHNFMKRLIP